MMGLSKKVEFQVSTGKEFSKMMHFLHHLVLSYVIITFSGAHDTFLTYHPLNYGECSKSYRVVAVQRRILVLYILPHNK
jgi:hypothetical protein